MAQLLILVLLLALGGGSHVNFRHGIEIEEELVSSLALQIHGEYRDCLFIFASDYVSTPKPFSALLATLHKNQSLVLPFQWSSSTPEPPPNSGPGNFEYWMSWLHRPTAQPIHKCTLFLIAFQYQNFEPILKYVAGRMTIETGHDRFVLWSRDGNVEKALLLPVNDVFLFQLGTFLDVDNTTLLMASNCHFCNKGYPAAVRRGMYNLENGIVPDNFEYFPDYSRNLHGRFLNGSFAIDLSKSELEFIIDNFLPMFSQLLFFLPLSQALNFDWDLEAV